MQQHNIKSSCHGVQSVSFLKDESGTLVAHPDLTPETSDDDDMIYLASPGKVECLSGELEIPEGHCQKAVNIALAHENLGLTTNEVINIGDKTDMPKGCFYHETGDSAGFNTRTGAVSAEDFADTYRKVCARPMS